MPNRGETKGAVGRGRVAAREKLPVAERRIALRKVRLQVLERNTAGSENLHHLLDVDLMRRKLHAVAEAISKSERMRCLPGVLDIDVKRVCVDVIDQRRAERV